uniref:Uncharacterized protein n=1 Tax=Tenebrio molitor TaxID=7067 RepID=A0A8J6L128_TENMO|nr:hypothetical protein GEV33_014973 [Tenebrio molitor]
MGVVRHEARTSLLKPRSATEAVRNSKIRRFPHSRSGLAEIVNRGTFRVCIAPVKNATADASISQIPTVLHTRERERTRERGTAIGCCFHSSRPLRARLFGIFSSPFSAWVDGWNSARGRGRRGAADRWTDGCEAREDGAIIELRRDNNDNRRNSWLARKRDYFNSTAKRNWMIKDDVEERRHAEPPIWGARSAAEPHPPLPTTELLNREIVALDLHIGPTRRSKTVEIVKILSQDVKKDDDE